MVGLERKGPLWLWCNSGDPSWSVRSWAARHSSETCLTSLPPSLTPSSGNLVRLVLLLSVFYVGGGSLVAKSYPTLGIPWTVVCQAPLSMGFSRQECWSGLPFPSPGDLPDPGIQPGSSALQADDLPTELLDEEIEGYLVINIHRITQLVTGEAWNWI